MPLRVPCIAAALVLIAGLLGCTARRSAVAPTHDDPAAPAELVLHDSPAIQRIFVARAADFARGTTSIAVRPPSTGLHLPGDGLANPVTYTSPIFELPHPFTDALVSWNIKLPDQGGYSVELRVGRDAGGNRAAWSPWLRIGHGGDAVPGVVQTSFADGRIDTDNFTSTTQYTRAQYRIRSVAPQPNVVYIARITLTFSDAAALAAATARADDAPACTGPRFAVPFRHQKSDRPELSGRLCSPASLSMVLAYHGVDLPLLTVADACRDPDTDIYGNWPSNIQAAYALGVPGFLTRFADWHDIHATLAAGLPLVITIRIDPGVKWSGPYDTTDGHLIVLAGFDEDGHVLINDPAYRDAARGQYSLPRSDLTRIWLQTRGGVAYVLLPR